MQRASEMKTITRLLMSFKEETGRTVSIAVDAPRENLKEAEIKTAMDAIIAANVFAPYGGALTECVNAKVVMTDETKYDLV